MKTICLVGLPAPLLKRLTPAVERAGTHFLAILAAHGKEGTYQLKPHPSDALNQAYAYVDGLSSYEEGVFVVLPYAPVPDDLFDMFKTFENDFSGSVNYVDAGVDGWPEEIQSSVFLDELFSKINQLLFPNGAPAEILPSQYFKKIADRCNGIIIPQGSLDLCDGVARHRYKFMREAADAFEAVMAGESNGGRLEQFFKQLGLTHAQSGGITAQLEVRENSIVVHKGDSQTHLKKGDGTTPQAAARVYYYMFEYKAKYLAVLYAGPHPESDCSRLHHLN